MLTATVGAACLAARMSDVCPSCRYPIVGTSPSAPSTRASWQARRKSCAVRTSGSTARAYLTIDLPTATARPVGDWRPPSLRGCVSRSGAPHPTKIASLIPRREAMTKTTRVPVMTLLCLGPLVTAMPASAQERPPIAQQIAKTYGLDSFGQIEAIRYTFNAELGSRKVHRTWLWEPKADRVSYDGPDKAGKPLKLTYVRSQLGTQDAVVKEQVDPAFLNDQYWLLFPLHLSWDSAAKVKDGGTRKLPLGKGSAQ